MSFKDLQINPLLITQLYRNVLIEIPDKKNFNGPDIPFLGNNQKKILIVVNEPNANFINDSDLQLLTGILNACKLTLADIAIINIYRKGINYSDITEELEPVVILLFGVELKRLEFPLHFPDFQVQKYNDQKFLAAPSLQTLAADVPAKKLLWSNLQNIFLK